MEKKEQPRPQEADRELMQLVRLIACELAAEHHQAALRKRNPNV